MSAEYTSLSDKSKSNLNRLLLLAHKAIQCIGSAHPDMSAHIAGIDEWLEGEQFGGLLDMLENQPDLHARALRIVVMLLGVFPSIGVSLCNTNAGVQALTKMQDMIKDLNAVVASAEFVGSGNYQESEQ